VTLPSAIQLLITIVVNSDLYNGHNSDHSYVSEFCFVLLALCVKK